MLDLRTVLSHHSLAVDHQRKVVKRTLGGDVVGRGGQSFTICGDFGLICEVYVVLVKKAMAEVIERSSVTVRACYSGKAGCPETTSTGTSTSFVALW